MKKIILLAIFTIFLIGCAGSSTTLTTKKESEITKKTMAIGGYEIVLREPVSMTLEGPCLSSKFITEVRKTRAVHGVVDILMTEERRQTQKAARQETSYRCEYSGLAFMYKPVPWLDSLLCTSPSPVVMFMEQDNPQKETFPNPFK